MKNVKHEQTKQSCMHTWRIYILICEDTDFYFLF